MAVSGCQFFFFWGASLICDKTALKALIAFFHSCEGDHMMDVPRREIVCLDSQIEKINHLRPTFNFIMGRFQTVLSGGIPIFSLSISLSLSLSLSFSAAARICLFWLSLGDCSCMHCNKFDLGLLL